MGLKIYTFINLSVCQDDLQSPEVALTTSDCTYGNQIRKESFQMLDQFVSTSVIGIFRSTLSICSI